MSTRILHKPLYFYLIFGLFLWALMYAIIPAKPTYDLSVLTISYISLCLAGYFLGYFVSKKYCSIKSTSDIPLKTKKNIIWGIIAIVCISWSIRYFDLFFIRGISINNTVIENRILLGNTEDNLILILGAVFKELYFLPLVLTLVNFKGDRKLLWVSSLVYIFPLIVPFLRGTRKDVFVTVIILAITLLLTRTIVLKVKTLLKLGALLVLLNVIFFNILMSRVATNVEEREYNMDRLIESAHYNDLLQPTDSIKEKIKSRTGTKKAILFNYVHILQYYCHGVFELDYLVKKKSEDKKYLYGEYSFNQFVKAFGKLGFMKYDSSKLHSKLPRHPTYITFLGALFLDFSWFGILGMVFLGSAQNIIDKKVKAKNLLYLSLYIFFIVFNILFPVINLLNGTGMYVVFSCMALIIVVNVLLKSKIGAYL